MARPRHLYLPHFRPAASGAGYAGIHWWCDRRRLARAVLLAGSVGGLAGCGGETVEPVEPAHDPTPLYWSLTLNHRAINLSTVAPYDTFRLVATARALDGTPLANVSAARFSSKEPSFVQVSPDGLVQAIQSTQTRSGGIVQVLATITSGNVTHVDTAFVLATTNPSPPVLAHFSLEPWLFGSPFVPGDPQRSDSAKTAAQSDFNEFYFRLLKFLAGGVDTANNAITGLAVAVEPSDRELASIPRSGIGSEVSLNVPRPGSLALYASMVAYGVEAFDTLPVTIGTYLTGNVYVRKQQVTLGGDFTYRFDPSVVSVGTGGYVFWQPSSEGLPYDVTFDNPGAVAADTVLDRLLQQFGAGPTACGPTAGNIAPFGNPDADFNVCTRHFPVPGEYRYHSAALNASGTIVVVDESQAGAATVPAMTRSSAIQPTAYRRVSLVPTGRSGQGLLTAAPFR